MKNQTESYNFEKFAVFLFGVYSFISLLNYSNFSTYFFPLDTIQNGVRILFLIFIFIDAQITLSGTNFLKILLFGLLIVIGNFDGMANWALNYIVIIFLANKDIKRYMKASYTGIFLVLFFTFVLWVFNFYPHDRALEGSGRLYFRMGFSNGHGFSDAFFGGIVLYIAANMDSVWKKRKQYIFLIVIFLSACFFNSGKTNAILGSILMIGTLLIKRFGGNSKFVDLLYYVCKLSYLFCLLFTLLTSYFYKPTNLWIKINSFFTGRIELQHWFLTRFPPKMLGQVLPFNSNTESEQYIRMYNRNYLVIDSEYCLQFLQYGIVVMVVITLLIFSLFKVLRAQSNSTWLLLWIIMSFYFISTHGFTVNSFEVLSISLVFCTKNIKINKYDEFHSLQKKLGYYKF